MPWLKSDIDTTESWITAIIGDSTGGYFHTYADITLVNNYFHTNTLFFAIEGKEWTRE